MAMPNEGKQIDAETSNKTEDEDESDDDDIDDVDAPKRIIDINIDCQEHIFRYLSVKDLVNVAEANKQLKPAAALAFNRQYSKMKFVLYNIPMRPIQFKRTIFLSKKYSNIVTVATALYTFKLLRLFGRYILAIRLYGKDPMHNFRPEILNYKRIMQYINNNCSESLVWFEMLLHPDSLFDSVEKQFKNVEHLSIKGGKFNQQALRQINEKFPNIRRLELVPRWFPPLEPMELPNVDDLLMDVDYNNQDWAAIEKAKPIISSNMHLRCLRLYKHYDMDTWRTVSEMRHLESLEMSFRTFRIKNYNGSPIHFPTVEHLHLKAYSLKDEDIEIHPINLFVFSNLKAITITCSQIQLTAFLQYIQSMPTVQKVIVNLHIIDHWMHGSVLLPPIIDQLEEFTPINPIPVELNLRPVFIGAKYVLEILNANEYITKVSVTLRNRLALNQFRKKISRQWKITRIYVKRRGNVDLSLQKLI